MKIIYIANVRMPTEKAHGIQIMKTCEALVASGAELELWLPERKNPVFESVDPFEFYGIKINFALKKFACIDLIGKLDFLPGIGFYLESKTFARSIGKELIKTDYSAWVFYSRDTFPLVPVKKAGLPYFYEEHTLSGNLSGIRREILQAARGVVGISQGVAHELKKYIAEARILVAPDGVDLEKFSRKIEKNETRKRLGFPENLKIVLYAGHLYAWKGAHTLAQAAESLPAEVGVYLLGGTKTDRQAFEKFLQSRKLTRAKLLPAVMHDQVPEFLAAADVLVLPNSGKADISRVYTSPLKLFEYMAARRPIVASDLPSIREILDNSTAIFFTPDDPLSLSKKIVSVLTGQAPVERLTVNAYKKVQNYSWAARAAQLKKFIEKQL